MRKYDEYDRDGSYSGDREIVSRRRGYLRARSDPA